MARLLVLGVGNILLRDEGVGVHAVMELAKEAWPDGVEFMDGGTFTQDIFYMFKDCQDLLVVDCVKGGKVPGTIYRLTEDDLVQDETQNLSVHDIDLLDSLRMAEMLGGKPRLLVVGVEPEKLDWAMELTPTVSAVFPRLLDILRDEIRRITSSWGASDGQDRPGSPSS